MPRADEHRVVIERRGRSHRACCECGWTGHAWNELRPAEADAWHHVFGDEYLVDLNAVSASVHGPIRSPGAGRSVPGSDPRSPSVESLVNRARALADSPSPYRHQAVYDLWRFASEDQALLKAAISEIGDLLWQHSQRSAGTADSEWLQLITAKRVLQETIEHRENPSNS
jgi:hypothetical protein